MSYVPLLTILSLLPTMHLLLRLADAIGTIYKLGPVGQITVS